MKIIEPNLHPLVLDLLVQNQTLFQASNLHDGPVHLLFPEVMAENISKYRELFDHHDVNLALHYAHKASQSKAFVKQAKKSGIKIDVASKNELESALACSYSGADISCTGPKNSDFLSLACKHQCLISLDSFEELERLREIVYTSCSAKKIDILIRLNNLTPSGRNLQSKPSRFGVPVEMLDTIFEYLKKNTLFQLRGFHFHHDGYDDVAKSGIILELLSITQRAYRQGFKPNILDIGGSFRIPQLKSPHAWHDYVEELCHNLKNGNETEVWGNSPYGLKLDSTGRLEGRDKVIALSVGEDYSNYLSKVFAYKNSQNQSIAKLIGDSLLTLMIEPGLSLIKNAGISLLKVIEVKNTPKESFIVMEGNMFSIGSRMFEPITDPLLISQDSNSSQVPFSAYIVGNLCREDDFIMKRKVVLPTKPNPGDILVFTNTAAYSSDFEETNSIQQTKGRKFVCQKQGHNWIINPEEDYASK